MSHPWRWSNTTVMDLISFKLLSFTFCFEFKAHHQHPLALQPFSDSILGISPLSPSLCPHTSPGMVWNGAGKQKRSGEERDWAVNYNSRVRVYRTMRNANSLKSTVGVINHDRSRVTTFSSLKLMTKRPEKQSNPYISLCSAASLSTGLFASPNERCPVLNHFIFSIQRGKGNAVLHAAKEDREG